jgi:hypothetical protein
MENIEQALERARARQGTEAQNSRLKTETVQQRTGKDGGASLGAQAHIDELALSSTFLQSNRIISQMVADPRSRSFDMLRTQILQSMDAKDWRVLAVTSPTANCGKTVTTLNLAISVARQPERSALVVDLDFQKPKVATILGLKQANEGVLSILKGEATLSNAVLHTRIGEQRVAVVPTASTINSSEMMASRQMAAMIQDLRKADHSRIIIIDLPPVLTSDDVIAILPQIDCVLLVAAVGVSTVAEIEECGRHLQSSEVVRVVLNKVPEAHTNYNYY